MSNLWDDNGATGLCTDSDLKNWEVRMPEMGKSCTGPDGNTTAYDNKRALVKKRIGADLKRRQLDPTGLQDLTQLNDAATFLELSLIYRDLAFREDNSAGEKAAYYDKLYQKEMEDLQLLWTDPLPSDQETPSGIVFATSRLMRG